MPQQSSPPYLWGAQQYPRQIDQWDDINNQNGRLKRTATFITLDQFNAAVNWNGHSDIVASFNFESPNNFSLLPYIAIANTNYALCISYRIGTVLTRYLLWNAAGSTLQNIVPYSGQVMLKNFRLEVWSTSQGNATEANGMQLFTSVLGSLDYRYGFDSTLVTDDGLFTNFGYNKGTVTLPAASLTYWLKASQGVSSGGSGTAITGWIDQVSIVNFLPKPNSSINVSYNSSDPYFNLPVASISTGGYSLQGAGIGANPGTIAVAFHILNYGSTAVIVDNGGGVNASFNVSGHITAYSGGATSNITINAGNSVPMLLVLYPNEGYVEIYNLSNGVLLDKFSGSSSTSTDGTIILGTLSMVVWEVAIYSNDIYTVPAEYYQLLSYFFSKYGYGAFLLPLNFPVGSTSTTN